MSASDPTAVILATLDRHLRSIWQGDIETYRATTSEDLSFFEWYISPVRIDGLDFHCARSSTTPPCWPAIGLRLQPSNTRS
ncbi:MAG: hypothetical protein N2383_07805 [Caldilineales bacterium]|nr:hypothetical protein [Caldilineales bacterium]